MGMTPCALRFTPVFDKDVLSPLLSSITHSTGFLAKLYKITQGLPDGANVPVSDLVHADPIVILSSSYREIKGLL